MRNHFKRHGKASGPSCIRDVPPKRLVDETAGGWGGDLGSGWNERVERAKNQQRSLPDLV